MNSMLTTGRKRIASAARNAFIGAALLANTALGGCYTRHPMPPQSQPASAATGQEACSVDMERGEQMGAHLRKQAGILKALYNRALKRDPALSGNVEVTLTIGKSGGVADVRISGQGANEEIREKYSMLLRRLQFAPSPCPSVVKFEIVHVCENCDEPRKALRIEATE